MESEADYSGSCGGSFALFDRDASCWKTPQRSLIEDFETFSEQWPATGTMRNGIASRRPSLVRITIETVGSVSPGTPVLVMDCQAEQAGPFVGPVVYDNDSMIDVETPDGFTDCFPREWIHPIATPQASDWKSGSGYVHGDKKQTPQLRHLIGGKTCPKAFEWLMGFPIGHTELER